MSDSAGCREAGAGPEPAAGAAQVRAPGGRRKDGCLGKARETRSNPPTHTHPNPAAIHGLSRTLIYKEIVNM